MVCVYIIYSYIYAYNINEMYTYISIHHKTMHSPSFTYLKGADTTIGERDGYTPMHGAGFQGRADIADLLFKAGVGLRDVHADGHEPAST